MEKLKLSPPWITFYHEVDALFKDDPDVKVAYNEDENVIKLFVENAEKADALTRLLPAQKTFGNITVLIKVIPANKLGVEKASLFQTAFEGNPAFAFVKTVSQGLYDMSYVVFKNRVVQFFNDDLSDINGNRSTLYQEIAKDVFGTIHGVSFCTDVEERVGES